SGRTVPRNTELGINVQDLFEKVSPTFEENLDDLMEELIGTDTGADTIRSLLERAEFRENEGNYSLMLIFRFFGWEAFDFEAYELIDAADTFEQDGETWVKFKELLLNFVPDPEEVAAEEEGFFDELRSYADTIDYIPGVSREEYLAFINTFEALLDTWLLYHFYPTLLRELAPGLSGSVDISDLRFAQEGAEGSSVTFYEGELGVPSIMNLDIGINERLEAQGSIGIPTMDIDLPELDSCLTIGHTQIQGLNAPLDTEGTRSNYHADSVVIDFMSFSKEIEPESGSGGTE
ncbi:MAG: hypothetical protein KDC44_06520, partial [Phaeodactylibacter sp.]|nr:hypothetical protein [Phaeodactylibacter sp.]